MSGSIPLHPQRMLDPHLCFCPGCGGESNSLTIGHLFKARSSRGWVYASRDRRSRTARELGESLSWIEVREGEKVPGELCAACQKEQRQADEEIAAGGIMFRCACGAYGVLRADAQVSKRVREELDCPAPKPCGIELTTCPNCE